MDEDVEIKFTNFSKIFSKVKWQHIVLIVMMIFAFYLRSYHIDYPTIGYHNMKEDHYTSMARSMVVTGNYLRTSWYDCSAISSTYYFGNPPDLCSGNTGEHPVSIWMLILLFTIFGWKLWVARGYVILTAVLTIIPLYMIVKKLSNSEYLALLSSFIYTILPLAVFFGRNIQMDAPAYLFSLMALYMYMKFVENNKRKDFIIACVFFLIAAIYKPLLLIVLAGLLFIIPWSTYKKYFTKIWDYKIEIIVLIITLVAYAIWPLYLAGVVMPQAKADGGYAGFDFSAKWFSKTTWFDVTFSILGNDYWAANKAILFSYFADNYSWPGFWLMWIGFALFLYKYKSKTSKFIMGYAVGIFFYTAFCAYKWNAHAYYQYPFLLFAAMCIANVFFQAGMLIKSFFKDEKIKKWVQYIPLLAVLLLLAPFTTSTNRLFDTQFFGQDLAGSYINSHTSPSDVFLLERGGQNEVSWTAQRFYYPVPDNASIIQSLEADNNLTYIVTTYSGVSSIQQHPSWQYITQNYHVVEVGFIQTQQGPQIYHMILKKGGTFNMTTLENRQAQLAETYELTYTKVPYYIIDVP